MKTRPIALLTALALVVAPAPSALAWGPQGHRVIARAAEERLTPAARAAIKELLHPGDTLPGVADWADHDGHDAVPGSAKWHFINVPISDARFDPRLIRDDNNVVVKIKQYRKVLLDRSKPKQDRQRALLFLVHFIEDIHQPLHVGDNGDHGGNDTQIQFFGEGTNLHKLWDSDLIRQIGGDDRAWLARVERDITPETVKQWSRGFGRRLGRRDLAGRQARLPAARRRPEGHPPRVPARRVVRQAGRADPEGADGPRRRPTGQRAERHLQVIERAYSPAIQ